jgi:hypothetical protein
MADDDEDDGDRGEREREDVGPVTEWILRGISNAFFGFVPRFTGAAVPDRDPVAASPWRPCGPTNSGGRVRALALDPELVGGRPRALFAGAASGGVFRSLDQGLSWESIWPNSSPTMAIGAIATGAVPAPPAAPPPDAGTRYVWVATGENNKIPGAGVWRAVLAAGADDPVAWDQAGTLEAMRGPAGALPRYLESAAVDPTNPRVCWFAGPTGVYRCTEAPAGTFTWARFTINTSAASGRTGPGCADVKVMSTTHGRYVVLACLDAAFGDLILLTGPDDPQAAVQAAINAAVLSAVGPAGVFGAGLATPLRPTPALAANPTTGICKNARLAIVPDAAGDRVYVVHTTTQEADPKRPLRAVAVGAIAAAGAPAAPAWVASTTWNVLHSGPPAAGVFDGQDQGHYNLAIAAAARPAPAADLVAVGMVDAFVSADAGVTFRQSLNELRYDDNGDRGQHADQHELVFAPDPGPIPALWVANDGGIAVTTSYLTAAGNVAFAQHSGWRRRVAGLVVAQPYDLSQSRALPDVQAVALQDLGGWMTGGSGSWRYLARGDGLGVAFDPHDPYHLVVATQGSEGTLRGANDSNFSGGGGFFSARTGDDSRLALFRGVTPNRVLANGLLALDAGTFEDLVAHPDRPNRLLHLRRRRLYGTSDGETWNVGMVGDRIELYFELTIPAPAAAPAPLPAGSPPVLAGISVTVGGNAALDVGFMPGATSHFVQTAALPADAQRYEVRIVSALPDPAVAAGRQLTLAIELMTGGAAAPVRFSQTLTIDFPAALAGVLPILARLRTVLFGRVAAGWVPIPAAVAGPLPGGAVVEAQAMPAFAEDPSGVEIVSDAAGPEIDLTLGGTAARKTRAQARAYRGDRDRPAVAMLQGTDFATTFDPLLVGVPNQVAVGDTLTVALHRTVPPVLVPIPLPIPLGDMMTYTWPVDVAAAGVAGPIDGFYTTGRQVAADLEGERGGMPAATRSPCRIWPVQVTKWVRLRSGGTGLAAIVPFALSGTALPGLTLTQLAGPTGPDVLFDLRPRKRGRFDLTPTPAGVSRLTVTIAGVAHDVDFDPADFGAVLTDVTVEEVRRRIDEVLNPAGAPSDVVVEVQREITVEKPYEVAYSAVNPEVVWVGGLNHLWVTTNGGASWRDLMPPPNATSGNFRNRLFVEAIAPDPAPPAPPTAAHPDRVYTAFVGVRGNVPPGFGPVFRFSTDPAVVGPATVGTLPRPAGYEPGSPLRVYALEADPRRAGRYYAATELGVYRLPGAAGDWEPFSEGLPHAPTLDLALDEATDTLRVAVHGRGVFERYLGDGAPGVPDVYLRANQRDAGRRPVAHGPDLEGDAPAWSDAIASPDIHLTSRPAAVVAALDATELDELPHEPARRVDAFQVIVRVNNRTPLMVDNANVIVLWAGATASLPVLPAAFGAAVIAGTIAAGTVFGQWTVLGDSVAPRIAAGDARLVTMPASWPEDAATHASALDAHERIALLAIVTRGRVRLEAGDSDVARLVVHDARVALRLTDVRRHDDGFVTLRVVPPATGPIAGLSLTAITTVAVPPPVPASAPMFAAIPAAPPAPLVVRSTNQAPFDVRNVRLNISYFETHTALPATRRPGDPPPAAIPPAPARTPAAPPNTTLRIDFAEAAFANPAAVSAEDLRTFLARQIAQRTRLLRVERSDSALHLHHTPADDGPRVGGAAWQSGELVATATGTAATDDEFALLALMRPATVAVGAARRFSVRVYNDGGGDHADATVRFHWLDPHADTPTAQQIGADQHVAVPAGQRVVAFVEAPIAAVAHDDVVVLAEVHAAAPAGPLTFASWDAVLAWAAAGTTTVARTFRRA